MAKEKQSREVINLRVIGGLLTAILAVLGYFGMASLDRLDKNTEALHNLEIALTKVSGKAEENRTINIRQDQTIKNNTDGINNNEKRIIILESKK